jgi:isocitrate dehydrogenase (NAD+)
VGEGCAVFEAVHGSAPDLAGKRLANPTAIVLSTAELLRYIGQEAAGEAIEHAVHEALADPAARTRDIGGHATLDQLTDAIVERLG